MRWCADYCSALRSYAGTGVVLERVIGWWIGVLDVA